MMKSRLASLLLSAFLVVAPSSGFQLSSAQQQILQRANRAYYNLPAQGLAEFQCAVVPDWSVTLKEELHQDFPPDHPAIKALNGIHFWLTLDEKGSAKLTHQLDVVPTDPQTLENYNQTISGVEEVLSGFSQSVAPFLLTTIFPSQSDASFSMETRDSLHHVKYKDGQSDVSVTLKEDLAITDLRVVSPELTATMRPQFTKTAKGYLISAFMGEYQYAKDAAKSSVTMEIEYAEVQGMNLPSKLRVNTVAGDQSHKMVFDFKNHEVKKR
jgi:hypothetical protein